MDKKIIIRISILTSVLIGAAIALFLTPLGQYMDLDFLMGQVKRVPDNWVVFVIFELIYVAGSWLLFPLTATSILAMAVFPFWKAVICALIGVFLSATCTYLIGRYGLPAQSVVKNSENLKFVEDEIGQYGYWAIAVMRLAPQPPFVATSVIAGSLRTPFWKYILATYVGLGPMLVLTFALGHQAASLMKDPGFITVTVFISLIALGGLFSIAKNRYLKKRRSGHRKQKEVKNKASTPMAIRKLKTSES